MVSRGHAAVRFDFLGSLSEECRSRVLQGAHRIEVPSATITYFRDDKPVVDVVESGLVRVFVSASDGRQASYAYIHERGLFGGPTVLGIAIPTAAQTVTRTTLRRLDAAHVLALFEEDVEVACAVARVLAVRLAETARLVSVRSLGSARERLAYDLLERACAAQLASGHLRFETTQEELADSIGSAREVVGRTLASFRRAGVVRTERGVVNVLDVERLSAVVQGLVD